tara:strand:+ start:507783 stop:509894 length:2112 start_codon:yes stop_codon:yes gene_type:complete
MKATEANLLKFLEKSSQFIIPIYQRTYSWQLSECQQLWDDLIRTGENDEVAAHFVGSVVYVEKGLYSVSLQTPLLVIDGQQRLTTVSIILEALARAIGDESQVCGFTANKIRNYYLLNEHEANDDRFKVVLTQTDKDSLTSLVQQKDLPANHSIRIKENFEFFCDQIQQLDGNLESLCKGLAKLVVVDVSLDRDQDNAQLIFESMNSTGRELSQADLIRNYILMGLEPELQTALYTDHWRPMELAFGQDNYGEHFDSFMRHYLTFKTGDIPRKKEVYVAFRNYARKPSSQKGGVEALVADIHAFADHYCAMALGKEPDITLARAFKNLRELRVDVAYPFLLELYHDYKQGILGKEDFLESLMVTESYVFRRAISEIPTNSHNKTFANFTRTLDKNNYLVSIKANYLVMRSYRRFPSDDEFRREIKIRNLYSSRIRSYWLRRLENADRKEYVPVNDYTIEHIMPQNDDLSESWRESLGPNWKEVQETWLHTLGNLTLTGYNSEYSDRPFNQKRDMEGGFKESPIRLNEKLGSLENWNEETIKQRADRLATKAVGVWASPEVSSDRLQHYQSILKPKPVYSIEDHPKLLSDKPMGPVFASLRNEISALDECVTEDYLKKVITYRAEDIFVSIIPLLRKLRLSLNMPFHEINDPNGKCKDITVDGRWGSDRGDVMFRIQSVEEIQYAMGLIRQAFERQIDSAEEVG